MNTKETVTVKLPISGGFGITEVTIPGPFKRLSDMKARNRQRRIDGKQGGEYWGRSEMRFFNGRTCNSTIKGRFVIDSRQFVSSAGIAHPREYYVCVVSDDGEVDKIAFPPAGWTPETVREIGENEGWVEFFYSAELARIALRTFLLAHTS